ncbi:TraK family protein [Tepidicaulis sp. LMO-SS28]|uniref:TraK family protein n=1 Tax=Tepidicaulis sp. LMO-SS28 TaxID=3447455 RepID=UPI003EE13F90
MSLEWGQAKIEVYALREEIFQRLERGQTIKRIYEELSEAGRIALSQRPFYRHVTRLRSEATRDRDPTRPQSANTTRRTRTAEPQASRNAQPSNSPAATTDGPRIVDAAFTRMPVSRDPSYSSGSAVDVDRDVWDGNFPKNPEASS